MRSETCHTRKYRNSSGFHRGGNPKPGDPEGFTEERNRRTLTEIANDRFVEALRAGGEAYPFAGRAPVVSTFEQQLAKVKAGASISEVIPFKRRADPDYSLTGGASRWMAS